MSPASMLKIFWRSSDNSLRQIRLLNTVAIEFRRKLETYAVQRLPTLLYQLRPDQMGTHQIGGVLNKLTARHMGRRKSELRAPDTTGFLITLLMKP